jgi:hypothetical protein
MSVGKKGPFLAQCIEFDSEGDLADALESEVKHKTLDVDLRSWLFPFENVNELQ